MRLANNKEYASGLCLGANGRGSLDQSNGLWGAQNPTLKQAEFAAMLPYGWRRFSLSFLKLVV
jgi:hypothetical protein